MQKNEQDLTHRIKAAHAGPICKYLKLSIDANNLEKENITG